MIHRVIKTALKVSAAIPLLLTAWFSFEFYLPQKAAEDRVFFVIEPGSGAQHIAHGLKEKGMLRKSWPFLLGYKFYFSSKTLKAGEYALDLPLSTKDLLNTFTEGRVYLHALTIPEGFTRREIAGHLESLNFITAEDFLNACERTELISDLDSQAPNLEGYLFPETYHLPRGIPAEKIVSTMVVHLKAAFSGEWIKRAEEMNMTAREVVTLASLIEKEASIPEEKALVSAVFHNRLRIKMKLDCDPTVIYALKEQGTFTGKLRKKDLQMDSPYNTYRRRGLPPGPICNPGREALKAALFPSEEEYLYFVSRNDGSHVFSRTFREHQMAVLKYQRR